MLFMSPEFWVALLQIIGVNIVLSGDNAVVIALAARGLPPHQQKKAIAWGSGAAVVMRIVLTIVAVELLRLPYLKLVGAQTGAPIGVGLSLVRAIAHIIDGIPCYVGYLWPLWDAKRQTFADKLLNTYVVTT